MASFIPLIRVAAAVPWIRWLESHQRPVAERLRAADLTYLPLDEPNQPAPLLNMVAFIRQQAELEGNDIGCRVVSATSIEDLANLGLVALSAPTPRQGLARIAAVLPRHCTHEVITVKEVPQGLLVTEYWHWTFDPGSLHMIQQYVAALIETLCRMTGKPGPWFDTVRLVPHPKTGLSHLQGWFGGRATPSPAPRLEMLIPNEIADAKLEPSHVKASIGTGVPADWTKLRDHGGLADSVRVVIAAMLHDGAPSVDRIAVSAGMSVRTFQRRLTAEGTSFSALLQDVRYALARQSLGTGETGIGALASDLGYSHGSALTRAVRRWTGLPPRGLRD